MTTLLWHTARTARLSHAVRFACRTRNLAHRPAPIPRINYSAYRIRQYSTGPEKPEDPIRKDGIQGEAKQDGKPAPGTEHIYNKQSPMSRGDADSTKSTGEAGLRPGWTKLSKAELDRIETVVQMLKDKHPTLQEMLDETLQSVREHGYPKAVQADMRKVLDGRLTPHKISRMLAITFAITKKRVDADATEASQPPPGTEMPMAQQKTPEEPGPSPAGQNQGSNKQEKKGKDVWEMDIGSIVVTTLMIYFAAQFFGPSGTTREITWQEFRNTFMDKGLVEKLVVINNQTVEVHLHREAVASMYPESPAAKPGFNYTFNIGSVEAFERKLEVAQSELGIPSTQRLPVQYTRKVPITDALLGFAPALLGIGALLFITRRMGSGGGGGGSGGIFGMGRSRAKKFNHETDVKVKFADVAGMDEAKQEIMEFVSFLREPGMYQKLGAKIPRGAILSGPPGTGKTLLAKATAGESGVPFFSVSGSEFVEMFVGVGASRVRDLFQNARKSTPCIIFIDEIDAIGKSRSKQNFGGGNDEREATLNQILTEMDGFNTSEQVVVLAGTNRADVLDAALMRPGRFDRHIAIDKPTMEGRKQIFKVHLKKIVTHVDTDYLEGRLAALTPGFSGADIANCVNEAALIAARATASSVLMSHFEQAIERVIGGLEKKSLVLSPEEKRTVAYHEAGHAICGWFFRWADPLLKVSIIPRGSGALGYAQYLPAGDTYLLNVNQLMDRLAMTLGGRVSEELHFDTVTSGASDDFNKVTRMATAMVTKWGMSPKIGYRYYEDDSQQQLHKPFSEETARDIDAEVRRIVDEAYQQCRKLLTEKKKEVGIVAEELLSKEVLTRDDMHRLLGPRPFPDKPEFSKYFDGSKGDRDGHGSTIPPEPEKKDPPILPGGPVDPNPAPTIFRGDASL